MFTPPSSHPTQCRVCALHAEHRAGPCGILSHPSAAPTRPPNRVQGVSVRLLGRPARPAIDEPRACLARIAHALVVNHRRRRALEPAWRESLAAMPEATAPLPASQAKIVDPLGRIAARAARRGRGDAGKDKAREWPESLEKTTARRRRSEGVPGLLARVLHIADVDAAAQPRSEPDRREYDVIGLVVVGADPADDVEAAVDGRIALEQRVGAR